ncbi:hypothetical protein B0H16DRAFT_1326474 [Mycena metata]|uniref:Uncharacterized protein n=1 Tax=Mycena metata TaxID=1033252 RepID=A0AAD7I917_9AGAR|nr:hypothetical protein B0H16DRAFT_1326474 [Mycena metata]
MSIDRLGGVIDLTLAKKHVDHYLPRHIRWLLPHLLGKHRVPLYFFYGKDFPFKEPIPDPLLAAGFWPDADELEYLRSLNGHLVFSPWYGSQSRSSNSGAEWVYTSLRNGALLPSPRLAPSVLAAPFPTVEPGSDQKEGEDVHAFMERRRLRNDKRAQHESTEARTARLAREAHASKGASPGKRGARVFIWDEKEGGFFIRRAYNRIKAAERWDEFTPAQRIYDSFSDQWNLCTALAPSEEAEPESFDDGDDNYEDFMPFHPPTSATEPADQDRGADVETLLGWQKQDIQSNISLRFGFAEPISPQQMQPKLQSKVCAWTVGDETWAVPETSALPTLLHYILQGDLAAAPADLCDLTSPNSDLDRDWSIDVNILRQQDKTLYEIRPRYSEASSPSILLESAATALQIIRSGWAQDGVDWIIRNLVKLGAVFHPSWRRPAHHHPSPAPISSRLTLGRRPAGYMPTFVDLGVYVQHRDAFLRSSRGHVALFYGGIVGRLARLVLSDFEDLACVDPSEDVLDTGARVASGNGEEALWYEALTEEEIRLICGVYMVETGT